MGNTQQKIISIPSSAVYSSNVLPASVIDIKIRPDANLDIGDGLGVIERLTVTCEGNISRFCNPASDLSLTREQVTHILKGREKDEMLLYTKGVSLCGAPVTSICVKTTQIPTPLTLANNILLPKDIIYKTKSYLEDRGNFPIDRIEAVQYERSRAETLKDARDRISGLSTRPDQPIDLTEEIVNHIYSRLDDHRFISSIRPYIQEKATVIRRELYKGFIDLEIVIALSDIFPSLRPGATDIATAFAHEIDEMMDYILMTHPDLWRDDELFHPVLMAERYYPQILEYLVENNPDIANLREADTYVRELDQRMEELEEQRTNEINER